MKFYLTEQKSDHMMFRITECIPYSETKWKENEMDREKNARFRELINKPGCISVPVCYDVLSARIMEQAGFELVAMGGNGTMASLIGYPDLGIATATEMINRARQIAARIKIPMYADADTGYGALNNIRRTIIDYEEAGVSGIHLEDQTMPKKCGAMAGVTVIPAEEMVEKIKLAVRSRKDPNFIIIGRTDSYSSMGIDEAIRRCKMYADAGADIVMPESISNLDELKKLVCSVNNAPVLCDLIDKDNVGLTDKEVEAMGFKIVCRGLVTILAVTQFLVDMMRNYREKGTPADYVDRCMNVRDYEKILGIEEENNIRSLFCKK